MPERLDIFSEFVNWDESGFNSLLEEIVELQYSSNEINEIRENVNGSSPYLIIAHDLILDNKHLMAIRLLKRCIELFKDDVFSYIMLATCFNHFEDEEKATFMLLSAKTSHENNEKHLIKEATGEDYGFIKEQFYDKNFVPSPSTIPALGENMAHLLYELGNDCFNEDYFLEAETCFRYAIKHWPTFFEASANIGSTLLRQKKYHEAIPALLQTLQIGPPDEIVLNNLGTAFLFFEYPIFGKLCILKACILKPDYEIALNNMNIKSVDEGLFKTREELDYEFWNPKRLSALVINNDARMEIESAELLFLNHIHSKTDNTAIASIRAYLAGFEKELKVSFFQPLLKVVSNGAFGNNKLTLGSMIFLLSKEVTDFITNSKRQLKSEELLLEKTKEVFLLSNSEIQFLANIINTLLPIRNAVAHGNKVDAHNVKICKSLVKAGLLLLMRAQLNKVFGQRFNFKMRLVKNRTNFTLSHWLGEGELFE